MGGEALSADEEELVPLSDGRGHLGDFILAICEFPCPSSRPNWKEFSMVLGCIIRFGLIQSSLPSA